MSWLYDNQWCVGIIYLVFGPMIAFFGGKWFPYIVSTLVGLCCCTFLCSISLSLGWMATTGGTVGTILIAIVVGTCSGFLVSRHFEVMFGLLGLIGGFFSGSVTFALISGLSGG